MNTSKRLRAVVIAAFAACVAVQVATPTVAANTLTAAQAAEHIGENATVCGVVASTRFAVGTKGQPTYLNFDLPYPRQVFAVVIWGTDRPKFGTPETELMGKRVCATGTIQFFHGKAEIIAREPQQIVAG
jgi:hypothetical protein